MGMGLTLVARPSIADEDVLLLPGDVRCFVGELLPVLVLSLLGAGMDVRS